MQTQVDLPGFLMWWMTLTSILKELGLERMQSDNSVWIYRKEGIKMLIPIHTDDFLLTCESASIRKSGLQDQTLARHFVQDVQQLAFPRQKSSWLDKNLVGQILVQLARTLSSGLEICLGPQTLSLAGQNMYLARSSQRPTVSSQTWLELLDIQLDLARVVRHLGRFGQPPGCLVYESFSQMAEL